MKNIKKLIPNNKITLIVISLLGLSQHALAVEPQRESLPIVIGTSLQFPTGDCTAGLIVKKTGVFNNITPYKQAIRYVVTASHCGRTGDDVRVNGTIIGKYIWRSEESDLGLVQVEPFAQRHAVCTAPSTGPVCSIGVTYNPRAVNKVLIASQRTRSEQAVPFSGTGSPADREVFCTSGAVTGILCTWGKSPMPPGWQIARQPNYRHAETFGRNVEHGDSGGPIMSFAGKIYGIISSRGTYFGDDPNGLTYYTTEQFFEEQPGYALAPTH